MCNMLGMFRLCGEREEEEGEGEELVTEAIGRLRLGRTCVMITHRISTARDADYVVGQPLFAARVRVSRRNVLRSNE